MFMPDTTRTFGANMVRIQLVDGTDFDLTDADEVAIRGSTLEVTFKAGGRLGERIRTHGVENSALSKWSVFLSSSDWRRLWYNAPDQGGE